MKPKNPNKVTTEILDHSVKPKKMEITHLPNVHHQFQPLEEKSTHVSPRKCRPFILNLENIDHSYLSWKL